MKKLSLILILSGVALAGNINTNNIHINIKVGGNIGKSNVDLSNIEKENGDLGYEIGLGVNLDIKKIRISYDVLYGVNIGKYKEKILDIERKDRYENIKNVVQLKYDVFEEDGAKLYVTGGLYYAYSLKEKYNDNYGLTMGVELKYKNNINLYFRYDKALNEIEDYKKLDVVNLGVGYEF